MKKIFLLLLLFIAGRAAAQDLSAFKKAVFIDGQDTLRYRILYPENFDETKRYPVLFFLHGSGERGNDNEKQLTHGGKLFLSDRFRNHYPAVVIFPQCPANSYWSNVEIESINGARFFNFRKGGEATLPMALLVKLNREFAKKSFVDRNRIYIGGLSMGGMGTFELLRRMRGHFAAAFSICGGDNPLNVNSYKNTPLWIFHGGMDDVVDPQLSYSVYKTLQELGHEPKYTIYPKATHNSWDQALSEDKLMEWLFGQHK